MIVEPADVSFADEARGRDFSFIVAREAVPPFDGPGLGRVVPVAPYRKSYPFDAHEEHRRGGDRMLMVAREGGVMLGYIAASRARNGYVQIDDIAVDAPARRHGVGRRLMDVAVGWAREGAWPGVAAETQSTNVDACRFYERCGFALGGFDRHLYRALDPGTREVALFWYLLTPTFR